MFKDLYKQGLDSHALQEERRRKILEEQKRLRTAFHDEHRQLEDEIPEMETETVTESRHFGTPTNHRETPTLEIRPMQSEWLIQRPFNLSEWLLVPCPKGQRCIVVAYKSSTKVFNKHGRIMFRFRTPLPGDAIKRGSLTVLDCVYNKACNTFYVLDVIKFASQDLTDCGAQFRFYWLHSRFEDYGITDDKSGRNRFVLLENYDFENIELINEVFRRYPNWPDDKPQLDGYLFYHKEAGYSYTLTPLMCWLFPFMITDVLGMTVHAMHEKPAEYVEPLQYMQLFDAQLEAKRKTNKHDIEMIEVQNKDDTYGSDSSAAPGPDILSEIITEDLNLALQAKIM